MPGPRRILALFAFTTTTTFDADGADVEIAADAVDGVPGTGVLVEAAARVGVPPANVIASVTVGCDAVFALVAAMVGAMVGAIVGLAAVAVGTTAVRASVIASVTVGCDVLTVVGTGVVGTLVGGTV